MTGSFLPRAERFTLLCSPGRSTLQQSALQFLQPFRRADGPRRAAEAAHAGCRDRTREATRGNANRGETHPPAVHADARHRTELTAAAFATRYSLSRFCPPPSVSDQRCSEDCRRQRCGPWCDPTRAPGLRCGTAQSSGAPPRRFRPLRSQVPRGPASHLTAAAPGTRHAARTARPARR